MGVILHNHPFPIGNIAIIRKFVGFIKHNTISIVFNWKFYSTKTQVFVFSKCAKDVFSSIRCSSSIMTDYP